MLMSDLIERLKNDHEHGSKEIAEHFLCDCRGWCATRTVNPDKFLDFLNQVDAARPSMVILQNITQRLRRVISGDIGDAVINEIDLLLKEMARSEQLIFAKADDFCQNRNIRSVLTHSRSSTVEYVLKQLGKSGTLLSLICTESRPLNEGVALANAVSDSVNTTIIVDALVDTVMNQCDCVFLGADAIDQSGNILNKAGSRLIALSAQAHSVPVIGLAETMKIIHGHSVASLSGEFHAAAELGHILNNDISVINQYFEVIENRLLSKIISD